MSRQIQLTRNKSTIVDDTDYEMLNIYKWHFTSAGYAARRRKKNEKPGPYLIFMHRFLLESMVDMTGLVTDHINGDKLDNRRQNLRAVNDGVNTQASKHFSNNTSGYRGVSHNKEKNLYQVYLKSGKRRIRIGYYNDIVLAARAYDYYARKEFGEYATLNFPDEVITELPIETRLPKNNTSGYRGVSLRPNGKWLAEFQTNKKKFKMGPFNTSIEAAIAYDIVAEKELGVKARLNFPCNHG